MTNQKKKNQRTIIILALMTLVPFSFAWLLTMDSDFRPGSTNNGDLIIPIITTERAELTGIDQFSINNIDELKGHWVMLNIIPAEHCNKVCSEAIHATKQIRLMINKDLTRIRRAVIVLQGEQQADYSSWRAQGERVLKTKIEELRFLNEPRKSVTEVRKKLQTPWWEKDYRLLKVKPSTVLATKVRQLLGTEKLDGQLILMDPLGNLMMQYKSGFDPYAVKKDIKKLLRISQIG